MGGPAAGQWAGHRCRPSKNAGGISEGARGHRKRSGNYFQSHSSPTSPPHFLDEGAARRPATSRAPPIYLARHRAPDLEWHNEPSKQSRLGELPSGHLGRLIASTSPRRGGEAHRRFTRVRVPKPADAPKGVGRNSLGGGGSTSTPKICAKRTTRAQ